jgi:hypothetical protein
MGASSSMHSSWVCVCWSCSILEHPLHGACARLPTPNLTWSSVDDWEHEMVLTVSLAPGRSCMSSGAPDKTTVSAWSHPVSMSKSM